MSSMIFCRSLPRSARHATPRAPHVARLLLAIVGDEVELSHQVRPGPGSCRGLSTPGMPTDTGQAAGTRGSRAP